MALRSVQDVSNPRSPADRSHRVSLLGPIEVTDEKGDQVMEGSKPFPTGKLKARLLIALALRSGEMVSIPDLLLAGWDDDYRTKSALNTPMSRLRTHLPIPERAAVQEWFTLDLPRCEVDALDFIDNAPVAESPEELDRLLDLWRADPMEIHGVRSRTTWDRLEEALCSFLTRVSNLDAASRAKLTRLEAFYERLPHWRPTVVERRQILIVDDRPNIGTELTHLLAGFDCVVARTLEGAMRILSDQGHAFSAAIVDLHLTGDLDESGFGVLAHIQANFPDLPRILLTRTPPKGSIIELKEKFGLFDVVMKAGESSPMTIRSSVEEMLGASASARIRLLHAALDSHVGNLKRIALRFQSDAKKDLRRRPDDAQAHDEFLKASLEYSDLEDELADLRARLSDDPQRIDEMKLLVDTFISRWSNKLGEAR